MNHLTSAERAIRNAAIDRLRFMQRDLRERYGIVSAMCAELEFVLEDSHGELDQELLTKHARHDLVEIRHVGDLHEEDLGQYEITLEKFPSKLRFVDAAPLALAAGVASLKKKIPPRLSHYGVTNISYTPYKQYNYLPEGLSSALHLDESLWSANGRPLFAEPEGHHLARHCVERTLWLQRACIRAFLPDDNAIARVERGFNAPRAIKHHHEKHGGGSVSLRVDNEAGVQDSECIRLEVRLPGADADPVVVTAISFAALYAAVTENLVMAASGPKDWAKLEINGVEFALRPHDRNFPHYEIADALKDKLSEEETLAVRDLLGDRLYEAMRAGGMIAAQTPYSRSR